MILLHYSCNKAGYFSRKYCRLRTRRALTLFKDVLLRTRRALPPSTLYSDRILLVLNRTSLNSAKALLALNWQFVFHKRWDLSKHVSFSILKLQYWGFFTPSFLAPLQHMCTLWFLLRTENLQVLLWTMMRFLCKLMQFLATPLVVVQYMRM